MAVKAIDIARKLNISKATVSLALNNKPGVSAKTRAEVLKCKEELEKKERSAQLKDGESKMIKLAVLSNRRDVLHFKQGNIDLFSEVFRIIESCVKREGYVLGLSYYDSGSQEEQQFLEECSSPMVAGVFFMGTEMLPKDVENLKKIKKPMIIYDNEMGENYNSINIDNVGAARDLVNYLVEHRCGDIKYLSMKTDIFNYQERRAGFRSGCRRNNLLLKEDSIVPTGNSVSEIKAFMTEYLRKKSLPQAFICEAFQVSIGTIMALQHSGYRVPEDVSVVGIDEVPEYMIGGMNLTRMTTAHEERAKLATELLLQEIQQEMQVKFAVASKCKLIEGKSVKLSR